MDALPVDWNLTVLQFLGVVVSLQRAGERGVFYGEGETWQAIPFRYPGAQVGHLTSFRAEGAPRVALPGAGLTTERACHTRHCTMLNPKIGQRSTLVDLLRGCDVQQSVKAALIDLREAEKFDPKFPALAPTNRGRLDGNRRTQIRRPDENSHR